MTCEEIRLKAGETYVKYMNTPVSPEKIRLLGLWKSLRLMYEDAYQREIKGEIPQDNSNLGTKERCLVEIYDENTDKQE